MRGRTHGQFAICCSRLAAQDKPPCPLLRLAQGESETAWLEFLQDLFLRGLQGKNLRLIVADAGKGLGEALPVVYALQLVPQRSRLRRRNHTKPINRPAATMPIHNRMEMKPETFAPSGGTVLSSQLATPR